MKKMITFILLITFCTQSINLYAFERKHVSDYEMKNCGKFTVYKEFNGKDEIEVCRLDEALTDTVKKTKGAEVQIGISENLLNTFDDVSEVIDAALLVQVKEKAKSRIETVLGGWEKSVCSISTEKECKDIQEDISNIRKSLEDEKIAPKKQIIKYLTIFPDIEDEIVAKNPEYKPLICKYEIWKHRQKVIKTIAKWLGRASLLTLLVAAPVVGYFSITSAPALMIGGGIGEVIANGAKIKVRVSEWSEVKAATLSKKLLGFYNDVQNLIDVLNKDQNKYKDEITKLQKLLPAQNEMNRLKDVKKLKTKAYKELVGGILGTAFGVAAVWGGLELYKRFADFRTDTPAVNTNQPTVDPYGPVGGDDGG